MIRYTDGVKQFGAGMNEPWEAWAAACCCCLPHQSCSSIFMLSNTQAQAAAAALQQAGAHATQGSFILTLHGRVWPLLLTAISCCNTDEY